MNDWVWFVDQRDVKGAKCCVIAFRGKKPTDLASIPDTLTYKKNPVRRNLVINSQSYIHNMLCVVELSAYPSKRY